MPRFARLVLLAALGCSTPGPRASGPPAKAPEAWRAAVDEGRLRVAHRIVAESLARDPSAVVDALELAAMLHDRARVLELAQAPALAPARAEPRARAALAEGLYWVAAPQALEALQSVCERGPEAPRARACARAAQVRELLAAKRSFEGGDADVELLPGLGLPVVTASVNGLASERFLLDSGAGVTMLSRDFCDRARIDYPEGRFQLVPRGPEGQLKLRPFTVDRLDLGGLRIRHFAANVVELPAGAKVSGVLAPQDLFAGLLAELDLRANRLRVRRAGSLADWRREAREPTYEAELLWSHGGIYVLAEVERVAGWFLFDTGASASLMGIASAEQIGQRLHHKKKPAQVFWGAAAHEADEGFSAMASAGGSPAVLSAFGIADRSAGERFLQRGTLGLPWMQGRRIAFGPDGRAIAFTAPAR